MKQASAALKAYFTAVLSRYQNCSTVVWSVFWRMSAEAPSGDYDWLSDSYHKRQTVRVLGRNDIGDCLSCTSPRASVLYMRQFQICTAPPTIAPWRSLILKDLFRLPRHPQEWTCIPTFWFPREPRVGILRNFSNGSMFHLHWCGALYLIGYDISHTRNSYIR